MSKQRPSPDMSITTEIQQYQDESREGWMPEKKADPAAKIMSTPRPTPETDQAWAKWPYAGPGVHANFARKLERERDEARDRAESKHGLWMAELSRVTELEKQLEAMREAIREAHACLDARASELIESALAKLQPLLP
jgi:hypothetical protein